MHGGGSDEPHPVRLDCAVADSGGVQCPDTHPWPNTDCDAGYPATVAARVVEAIEVIPTPIPTATPTPIPYSSADSNAMAELLRARLHPYRSTTVTTRYTWTRIPRPT